MFGNPRLGYNIVLVKRSTFAFCKSVVICYHVLLFSTWLCFPRRVYNCCFIGCKDKTSSWHLNGFPDGINHGSTVQCRGKAHRCNVHSFGDSCCLNYVCVCVCFVFSSNLFWTSGLWTYQPGHTGFLIHLPSAVLALIFPARRIQPFLSLVDREV